MAEQPRMFELDAPDAVIEALRCRTCKSDPMAVQEDPDIDTVTLVASHWTTCQTHNDNLWKAVGEVGQ